MARTAGHPLLPGLVPALASVLVIAACHHAPEPVVPVAAAPSALPDAGPPPEIDVVGDDGRVLVPVIGKVAFEDAGMDLLVFEPAATIFLRVQGAKVLVDAEPLTAGCLLGEDRAAAIAVLRLGHRIVDLGTRAMRARQASNLPFGPTLRERVKVIGVELHPQRPGATARDLRNAFPSSIYEDTPSFAEAAADDTKATLRGLGLERAEVFRPCPRRQSSAPPAPPASDDDAAVVMGGVVGSSGGGQVAAAGTRRPSADGTPWYDSATMGTLVKVAGQDPPYPEAAKVKGSEGVVIAQCTIDTTGNLEDCRILKSHPDFEGAVLQALRTRRYRPVLVHGKPARVRVTLPFRFALRDNANP
jgi:TonB family protein